ELGEGERERAAEDVLPAASVAEERVVAGGERPQQRGTQPLEEAEPDLRLRAPGRLLRRRAARERRIGLALEVAHEHGIERAGGAARAEGAVPSPEQGERAAF